MTAAAAIALCAGIAVWKNRDARSIADAVVTSVYGEVVGVDPETGAQSAILPGDRIPPEPES